MCSMYMYAQHKESATMLELLVILLQLMVLSAIVGAVGFWLEKHDCQGSRCKECRDYPQDVNA